MSKAAKVLDSMVPITQFNRGQASRIFDRLKTEPQLIVLKNNQPAAVILSPAEYRRLCEIEEDCLLYEEAVRRLEENKAPALSEEEVLARLGITQEEIDAAEEVEIE